MIISHSKQSHQIFRIKNSSRRTLHIRTELWCEEFELEPGDTLQGCAAVSDLQDELNPLTFETYFHEDFVALWCPYEAEFQILKGEPEI